MEAQGKDIVPKVSDTKSDFKSDEKEEETKAKDPTQAIIYCRVSSAAQKEGVSLDVQEQVCIEYCQRQGWKVSLIIKETASATDTKKQKQLLKAIQDHKAEKVTTKLIVYNISRFSRNVSKGLDLARQMRDQNLHLVSSMEMIDVSSAFGEYNLTNLLNSAEFESKLIGKRVKDALDKKKSDGHQIGKPPYGSRVEKIDEKRKFVPDIAEQKVIEFIKLCRTPGTFLKNLNSSIQGICDEQYFTPIVLNTRTKKLVEALSFDNIAELLTEYKILHRQSCWSSAAISRIFHRRTNNTHVDAQEN